MENILKIDHLKMTATGQSNSVQVSKRLETDEDFDRMAKDFDNFLLDCDGVLWAGGSPLPGALETVEELRRLAKRVVFITNNSSKSRRQYAKKLTNFGLKTDPNDVVTSGSAMADYLRRVGIKKVYVVGEGGLLEELRIGGIEYIFHSQEEPTCMEESEFMSMALDPTVEAVCVGWNRAFSFRHICVASAYLQKGCKFIGANPDNADRVGALLFPGTGPLLASIQSASGITPYIIGKPNPSLVKQILEMNQMDPLRSVMIGDRIDTDIAFANAGGITSALVLTGVCTEEDVKGLSRVDPKSQPSFIMSSLGAILPALRRGVPSEA